MDEKKDKPDEQAAVNPESAENEEPELRDISEKELKQILEEHKKWLDAGEKGGKQADLSRADLQFAKLHGSDLRKADLQRANLYKASLKDAKFSVDFMDQKSKADTENACLTQANLIGAEFQNSVLRGVDFKGADLSDANLTDADICQADFNGAILDRANFTKAKLHDVKGIQNVETSLINIILDGVSGLRGNEFARKNITGATLPGNINEFEETLKVVETSKNARKIFFSILLGCVYSWLTIATTTDVRLLTNSASSPLPIIGTEIPIAYFYWAAPFVLIGLYLYFHFYLDNLWKGLASLPAIFPDGKPLDQRAYPWLLNCIVCRHFELLKNRPLISHMKELVTIFLAWWAVPLTFIGFWLRYLPRHEWFGTWLHIVLLSGSVALAIIFYRMCAQILRGLEKKTLLWKKIWRGFHYTLTPIAIGVMLFTISYGAIKGIGSQANLAWKDINHFKLTHIVPWAFQQVGFSPFANFREKDVSIKPNDYYKIEDDEKRFGSVKGANLKDRNLAFADMVEAFLIKADLRNANLQQADLNKAKLQKANLENADLRPVNLEGADLQSANLKGAKLLDANLSGANLQNANLSGANLQNANLEWANLQKANLKGADLQNTDFMGNKLMEANLSEANLYYADLFQVQLQNAYIVGANLEEARIIGANLSYANLSGCKGLTQKQIDTACGNEDTSLPSGLTIQKCPEKRK